MNMQEADQISQELWNQDVEAWEKWWVPIFRKFARDLVLDARISPGQVVLDVGTGTGVTALEAATHLGSSGLVVGIDRSEQILTRAHVAKGIHQNVRFFKMNAEQLLFPNGFFDVVLSNSGISYAAFHQTIAEISRVIRNGGWFVFADWHLIDVPAHRTFSEVLRRHRTDAPSDPLRCERSALATMEKAGNLDVAKQLEELQGAGFAGVEVGERNYKIRLDGIQDYLNLRLERVTLKHEMAELSESRRSAFIEDLTERLKSYIFGANFIFDWKVNFIRAQKSS
jgi:SAM-dependent methyltransferase